MALLMLCTRELDLIGLGPLLETRGYFSELELPVEPPHDLLERDAC